MIRKFKKNRITSYLGSRIYRIFQHEFSSIRVRIGQQTLLSSKLLRQTFTKLSDAEVTIFSQWGEDGILDYLSDVASLDRPTILELGAGNFEECNSRFLIENRLSNSVLVDARKDLVTRAENDGAFWKTHLLAINSWITPETIKDIQSTARAFLGRIDIVSVDIDGNDFWVMREFDFTDVSIVVAEYNPLFGASFPVTIPRDDSFVRERAHHSNLYYGVGLRAWVNLFESHGLVFVGTNKVGSNAFFIRKQLLPGLHFVPNPDLNTYINWGVRESRSSSGKLSFLSGAERISEISHLKLFNVETGKIQLVGDSR